MKSPVQWIHKVKTSQMVKETLSDKHFAMLTQKLLEAQRTEDLLKATKDKDFRNKLFKEFELN